MTLDKNIINKLIRKFLKFTLWIIIFVISLSIILFLVYGLLWEWSMYKPLMAGKFDSYEWKLAEIEEDEDGTTKDLTRRCKMYHDLTSNYLKKDMTIKEVEDLLGPIDSWGYCKNQKVKCHDYYMGTCYANALSRVPMGLHVCFNRDGKLLTYDRDEHCEKHWPFFYDRNKHAEMLGNYYIKNKEQFCMKTCKDGTAVRTDKCGIDDPW